MPAVHRTSTTGDLISIFKKGPTKLKGLFLFPNIFSCCYMRMNDLSRRTLNQSLKKHKKQNSLPWNNAVFIERTSFLHTFRKVASNESVWPLYFGISLHCNTGSTLSCSDLYMNLSSFSDWVFIRIFGGKQATSYKAKWNREFTKGILGRLE